ncbi:MAG: NADH-quinone oxidoreductase subunit N [Planctomycetia bacterium]
MSFYQLLSNTIEDIGPSLTAFRPELVLCGLIVVLLFLRMLVPRWKMGPFWVTTLGSIWAFYLLAPWNFLGENTGTTELFTGVLVQDGLSVFLRAILLGFTVLFTLFTQISGVPEPEDATEFFTLVLGAVIGMCLMVSANHMLMIFLGMEMASVPSYVLAGILRGRRVGSEAALKYAVYGAAAAGVMLYGISLLCGALGTAHLPTMGTLLADMLQSGTDSGLFAERQLVLTLGGLMVAVGVAFKLSAVPFHFWAPDVFEGATAEVGAMLSIVSKAAALGLLLRLVMGFGYVPNAEGLEALAPVRHFIVILIGTLAVITCTFGNLAAYGQTNFKRLLAYSTIAHAGYMMMPVAAVAVMMGDPGSAVGASKAVSALLFYITVYLFMNLGAFAFVAFVRNAAGDEEIDTLAGLIRHSTGLAVVLAIVLFSLIGLPPFAGFAAKFVAFAAVWDGGLIWLVVIGVLNTALSLFYYLRIVKTMMLDKPAVDRPPVIIQLWSPQGIFCLAVVMPLIVWGIWWNGLATWTEAAAALLFRL